jgi:uncharacterized protein YbaR (Trm112 family)
MRKSMLDILACPIDKHYPLELEEFKTIEDSSINEILIQEGILSCPSCNRFFPIIEEIPILLPDELRDRQKDIEFLKIWRERIPEKIIKYGNPWHL